VNSTSLTLEKLWAKRAQIFQRIMPSKLESYNKTRAMLNNRDVSKDREYQKNFNGFYRMRSKPAEWYSFYFSLLECEKDNSEVTVEYVARLTFERMRTPKGNGRVEPSFSSKLVATIRDDAAVYDSQVLDNLGIPALRQNRSAEIRLDEALRIYRDIQAFYSESIRTDIAEQLRAEFDSRFSKYAKFSQTKKLDLMLWQMRAS
jgi:hypothetical protein